MSSLEEPGSKPGRKSRKPGISKKEPKYVSLRPGALAVTQLPAYSFEVEQYRNLSLQIEERFDPEDTGSHVLAIAGPDPSSGKTLTSLNLALIFSRRSERKVLLVEGDLWRPSFGSIFQLQADTVGMTDLLRDEKLRLDDALFSVWGTGLSVLTAGQRAGEGDLVTSRRMDELVVAMKSRFDLVVFDTPPFGLASGRYLTGFADSVVVVVRAGKTHKNSIRATLDALEPETVVGLVLNDVRRRRKNYAYYSSYAAYYGGEYGSRPRGWSRGFWKRPLLGLGAAAGALAAVAGSVFAILRGKPAEAQIEPAWIVAGVLLILTLTSWAVAIGMRKPFEQRREAAIAAALAEEGSPFRRDEDSQEEEGSETSMPGMPPGDPAEDPDSPLAEEAEEQSVDGGQPDRGITITNLNLRRQPALDGDYLTTLPRGTSFDILERAEDWYLIQTEDLVGWVAKLGVQVTESAVDEAFGEVATFPAPVPAPVLPDPLPRPVRFDTGRTNTNLNLRRQPGRAGEYLTTLPEGTSLEILAEDGDWYEIRAGAQAGWVFKQGVTLESSSLPEASAGGPSTTGTQQSAHWVPPKFLGWDPPSYTITADSKGVGEELVATVEVAATGAVVAVGLAEGSRTDRTFNEAVLASLRTAAFRPAFRDGVAVAARHQVKVKYQESQS